MKGFTYWKDKSGESRAARPEMALTKASICMEREEEEMREDEGIFLAVALVLF